MNKKYFGYFGFLNHWFPFCAVELLKYFSKGMRLNKLQFTQDEQDQLVFLHNEKYKSYFSLSFFLF